MAIRRVKPWRRSPVPRPALRFRLHGWRHWGVWLLFSPLLVGGLLLLASADTGTSAGGALLLLICGAMLAGWECIWRYTVLELSATGLRLRQVGYTLQTPWHNVIGLHGEGSHEGFLLQEPLATRGARTLAFFSPISGLGKDTTAGWIGSRRFIPIEAFAWHLRKGTLAADVSALAPHLADAMSAARAPV